MEPAPLSASLRDLVERVASHPHGLGFLHLAPLESVAVTLGVSLRVADEARQLMETPSGRARMIAEVRRARREGAKGPAAAVGGAGSGLSSAVGVSDTAVAALAKSAEELVERARRHPLGVRFLLRAPLDSVAITLQAHPFLVLHTRRMLHRRGRADPRVGDEDTR